MKKITMTFTVLVDDEPVSECGEYSCDIKDITKALYDHICLWDFNVHGSVWVEDESVVDEPTD